MASQSETASGAQSAPQGESVVLGEFIRIFPHSPLPQFNKLEAKAYLAQDSRDTSRDIFALICDKAHFPRVTAMNGFMSVSNPNLMQLISGGILDWTPVGSQRLALIFERPVGKPILENFDTSREPMSEDSVMESILLPVINVLSDIRNRDLVHGCVNPFNIYVSEDSIGNKTTLGECLSGPPSYGQLLLFETIERGMADSSGRGLGVMEDDLYALGITVVLSMIGRNPLAGKSNRDILLEKIDKGSYGALLGKERLPGGINEFLRGVLNDDSSQRWNMDEALKWIDGRRLSPKQPQMKNRAARPIELGDEKFWRARSLTIGMSGNQNEAVKLIESGEITQWLQRSVEDEEAIKRVEWAVDSAKEGGSSGYYERLVSRVCSALDPSGPIRYSSHNFFPAGFGDMLAENMAQGKDIQTFADVLTHNIVSAWFSNQSDMSGDMVSMGSQFENCRSFLRQKVTGYGIERVLYYMNKEAPCLSPVLKDFYVTNPPELLFACETLASKDVQASFFIDRHMAAFLSVRDKRVIDRNLSMLDLKESSNRVLGTLTVFSNIQSQYKLSEMPALSGWISSHLNEIVSTYHNRITRERMTKQINKVKISGDLTQLLSVVSDQSVIKEDEQGFNRARAQYTLYEAEKQNLIKQLSHGKALGKRDGREVAVGISCICSALIVLGITLLYFLGKY